LVIIDFAADSTLDAADSASFCTDEDADFGEDAAFTDLSAPSFAVLVIERVTDLIISLALFATDELDDLDDDALTTVDSSIGVLFGADGSE